MSVVLALDPSGNFFEGKGTTGWCIARDGYIFKAGQIYAAEYKTQMEYWTAVTDLIKRFDKMAHDEFSVVCEDYRLYASRSESQINSNLETPQLIGVIKWMCHIAKIPITLQMASEVKNRWSDDVLIKKGMLIKDHYGYRIGETRVQHHSLDAVRHCLHYTTFKDDKKKYKSDSKKSRIRVYRQSNY